MQGIFKREAPHVMPPLSSILSDLGNPTAAAVADFLGIHPRTVARWVSQDAAPRSALLALYWLTRWGRSQIECAAVNDVRLAYAQLRAQLSDLQAARASLAAVLSVADFGSANAPTLRDTLKSPRSL